MKESIHHANDDIGLRGIAPVPGISGLYYNNEFLDQEEHERTLAAIDGATWHGGKGPRMQQLGGTYDERKRSVEAPGESEELPAWAIWLAKRAVRACGRLLTTPTHILVTEYRAEQGMAPHVEPAIFGPAIATVSLGDSWTLRLRRPGSTDRADVLLRHASLLLLTGEARERWTQEIRAGAIEDGTDGRRHRRRRLSVTFRTLSDKSAGQGKLRGT